MRKCTPIALVGLAMVPTITNLLGQSTMTELQQISAIVQAYLDGCLTSDEALNRIIAIVTALEVQP